METEGRLDMYQPMVYKAVDVAEAMWMYRDWLNKTKQDDVTGWGWNYRELK